MLFFLSFCFPEQFGSLTCYTDGMFQSKFPFKDNKVLSCIHMIYGHRGGLPQSTVLAPFFSCCCVFLVKFADDTEPVRNIIIIR